MQRNYNSLSIFYRHYTILYVLLICHSREKSWKVSSSRTENMSIKATIILCVDCGEFPCELASRISGHRYLLFQKLHKYRISNLFSLLTNINYTKTQNKRCILESYTFIFSRESSGNCLKINPSLIQNYCHDLFW